MLRSDEYRRFAAECLKMAQTAEEEQNRATFCQWRECGLPPRREKEGTLQPAMTIQRIKCRSYLLLPQPLPQPLSKLLPFPAILFVRPPSVRISLGRQQFFTRILGIVLVTVPRGKQPSVPAVTFQKIKYFGRLEPDKINLKDFLNRSWIECAGNFKCLIQAIQECRLQASAP